MKHILLLLAVFVICNGVLYSQSAKDQVEDLAEEKNYVDAAKYIPDAIRINKKDLDLFILAGDIYTNLDMLDSALTMYLEADDLDGSEPYIMRRVGKAYSMLGKHDQAMEWLYEAIDEDEDDVLNHLELGQALIRADSLDKAELVITRARSMDDSIADAWIALGDLYYAQKVYELAKSNYEQALEINEDNTEARVNLAQSYFQMAYLEYDEDLSNELFTKSLNQWDIVTRKDPKNARAFKQKGHIFYMAKRYKNAAPSFYQYLQLRPDDIDTRWKFAASLFEIGQCKDAEPELETIVNEYKNDSIRFKAKNMLAKCKYDNEDFEGSITLYEDIKKEKPLDETQLKRMATASFKMADTTKGIEVYKELINKDTTECSLMYSLAILMLSKKDYPDSKYFFEKRIDYCSDSLDYKVYYFLGSTYANTESPDTAKTYLLKSIELRPDYYKSHVALGDAYAALDLKDSAVNEFEYVLEKAEKDSTNYTPLTQAFAKLCGIYLEDAKYSSLQKTAKDWTGFDPKSEYAFLYLAISYHGQRDLENACRNYRKVLAINPKNKNARNALSKLECP